MLMGSDGCIIWENIHTHMYACAYTHVFVRVKDDEIRFPWILRYVFGLDIPVSKVILYSSRI